MKIGSKHLCTCGKEFVVKSSRQTHCCTKCTKIDRYDRQNAKAEENNNWLTELAQGDPDFKAVLMELEK